MEKVTVEQTLNAIDEHQIRMWASRSCSMCYTPLTYMFHDDDRVSFDSNCGCVTYTSTPQEFDMEEFISRTFNLQSKPEVRERMWNEFIAAGASHQ